MTEEEVEEKASRAFQVFETTVGDVHSRRTWKDLPSIVQRAWRAAVSSVLEAPTQPTFAQAITQTVDLKEIARQAPEVSSEIRNVAVEVREGGPLVEAMPWPRKFKDIVLGELEVIAETFDTFAESIANIGAAAESSLILENPGAEPDASNR